MATPQELAAAYGTPAYIYDLRAVGRALDDLRAALPTGVQVYYSAKANPHPDVIAYLAKRGCALEITSPGEVASVVRANVGRPACLYTGPGKTERAQRTAIAAGIRLFSVESPADLRRVDAIARELDVAVECLVRCNGAGAPGARGLRMTGVASQFGNDEAGVREILRDASTLTHARLVGAHFYPSTNAASEDDLLADLEATVSTAAGLAREGLTMRLLDVGGGFAAPYARPGRRPHYSRLRDGLAKLLDRYFPGWTAGRPQVAVESGRYLVADCGTLVTQVLDLKTSHGRRFAVVDAGINQLGGMSALRRVLPMAAYPDQAIDDAQQPAIDLAGPLCTPGDVLGRNVVLPPGMAIGDLLTVPNVGAYGLTASLIAFLGHPVAAEIVVDGEQIVSASRLESRRVAVPTEY